MNIEEGNRLIAEYEGFRYIEDGDSVYNGKVAICVDNLEYHSSWDWLMPVVEKIENMEFTRAVCTVTIQNQYCSIMLQDETDHLICETTAQESTSKIDTVWQTLVKFIKYNENTSSLQS